MGAQATRPAGPCPAACRPLRHGSGARLRARAALPRRAANDLALMCGREVLQQAWGACCAPAVAGDRRASCAPLSMLTRCSGRVRTALRCLCARLAAAWPPPNSLVARLERRHCDVTHASCRAKRHGCLPQAAAHAATCTRGGQTGRQCWQWGARDRGSDGTHVRVDHVPRPASHPPMSAAAATAPPLLVLSARATPCLLALPPSSAAAPCCAAARAALRSSETSLCVRGAITVARADVDGQDHGLPTTPRDFVWLAERAIRFSGA